MKYDFQFNILRLITTYTYWDLFLHNNQSQNPGRCYARARRQDLLEESQLTKEELNELQQIIIPEWDKTISYLFHHSPAKFSFHNEHNRLHCRLIPQYENIPQTPRDLITFREEIKLARYLPNRITD